MDSEQAWQVCAMGERESFHFESPGFNSLFGYGEEKFCSPVIAPSDAQLLSQVEAIDMTEEKLKDKLGFLTTYAELEQRDVIRARPFAKIGCSLNLVQKQTGEICVSHVTMFTFESTRGEVFSVSIYDDATIMCSARHLLDIAGTGEYFVLLRALHIQQRCMEARRRVGRLEAFLRDLLREDCAEGVSGGSFGLTQTSLPWVRRPANQSTTSGRSLFCCDSCGRG